MWDFKSCYKTGRFNNKGLELYNCYVIDTVLKSLYYILELSEFYGVWIRPQSLKKTKPDCYIFINCISTTF